MEKLKFNRPACFERGDIILNYKMSNKRLILSITEDGQYEFMQLEDLPMHDIFGTDMTQKKGDIGKQPIDIVERYFCLYKIE